MFSQSTIVLVGLLTCAFAQTFTLSGCHTHGDQEFCYLPNGSEVPFTRTPIASGTPTSAGQTSAPATVEAVATSAAAIPASVTGCHAHGIEQFCLADGTEYEVLQAPAITPLPTAYNGCHGHGSDIFCMASDGSEVPIALEGAEHTEGETHEDHDHAEGGASAEGASAGKNCHFHGNVEHCLTDGESEGGEKSCEVIDRDYNMGLRIGLIFVILVASAFAVFSPMLLQKFTKMSLNSIVFTILKQFGTGVILSTAFVHLLSHAQIMFSNSCIGELLYEAPAPAIAMAGVFLSFLVEYIGNRLVARRTTGVAASTDVEQHSDSGKETTHDTTHPADTTLAGLSHAHSSSIHPDTHFSVMVMEAGIVFHSILIGITLNVTPNPFYTTLFVVILFHQMFEGLALGTRIAALSSATSTLTKTIMAAVFTLITPIGMAIGAGVLNQFNGNDSATIWAIGTLDALSAGILLWVGLVEMLAHDWMSGDMKGAGKRKVVVGLVSLMFGMGIMSFLGKWA